MEVKQISIDKADNGFVLSVRLQGGSGIDSVIEYETHIAKNLGAAVKIVKAAFNYKEEPANADHA